jgi:hypothetical protein
MAFAANARLLNSAFNSARQQHELSDKAADILEECTICSDFRFITVTKILPAMSFCWYIELVNDFFSKAKTRHAAHVEACLRIK